MDAATLLTLTNSDVPYFDIDSVTDIEEDGAVLLFTATGPTMRALCQWSSDEGVIVIEWREESRVARPRQTTNHAPGTEAFLSEARCPCCGAPSWYGGCPWGKVESGPYMMRARAVACGCGWVGVETDLIHLPPNFMFCGLNADWSVTAFALGFGEPNVDEGILYLTDNEDGTFSIVRRWFSDDDNDRIEEVDTFDTFAKAITAAHLIAN